MRTNHKPNKSFINKIIFLSIFIILLGGIVIAIIERDHILDFLGVTKSTSDNTKTTSTEPSAQSDFTNGKERETTQTTKEEGTVTDSNGVIPTVAPKAEWSSSTDGVISVYSPAQNSILSNGQILSGESTANTVSFRLIDNISGLIAQGKIGVVNGKFSGIFNFETTGAEGRLDVFIADANGIESSIIEIPVRFSQ